jgi:hypothetical protein
MNNEINTNEIKGINTLPQLEDEKAPKKDLTSALLITSQICPKMINKKLLIVGNRIIKEKKVNYSKLFDALKLSGEYIDEDMLNHYLEKNVHGTARISLMISKTEYQQKQNRYLNIFDDIDQQ